MLRAPTIERDADPGFCRSVLLEPTAHNEGIRCVCEALTLSGVTPEPTATGLPAFLPLDVCNVCLFTRGTAWPMHTSAPQTLPSSFRVADAGECMRGMLLLNISPNLYRRLRALRWRNNGPALRPSTLRRRHARTQILLRE